MSKYISDLVERVITTFAGAFGASLFAVDVAGWGDLSVWQSAGLAGSAAAVSLLKGVLAKGVGNSDSASVSRSV